jgi:misacylated tRNA(Ala) deacylase
MTDFLFHTNSYLKTNDTVIIDIIENTGLVLENTVFYPGGGGQPSDLGTINTDSQYLSVIKVQSKNGVIIHWLDQKNHGCSIGDLVTTQIDWNRRYKLMRTHTALNILCGVVWRDYKAQVTGGDMQIETARMDFEFDHITSEFAQEIEKTINDEVNQNRDIKVDFLTREAADNIPDLIRTKVNLLPDSIKVIRTIHIEGLDLQADGGTHVANTGEVGRIRITGHESKGKINKRLRIAIDPL